MSKENIPAKLPTRDELILDKEMDYKQDTLNYLLNTPPVKDWIKEHPYIKSKNAAGQTVPYQYIPIERVEWLLTRIFKRWKVEIKDSKLIANSVVVTVRLHVHDPLTNEWEWQDGIGAAPIQTEKGAGATEFDKMSSSAISMGAPSAESYAIKDAAEKFGKVFGKDLNRKDMINYTDQLATKLTKAQESKEIIDNIKNGNTVV